MRLHLLRDRRGQASPEWIGVLLVVSLAFAGIAAAGVRVPGADLAGAIAGKLACAANLGEGCGGEPSALVLEYGQELAATVADHVPLLAYEDGMLALPVDYRECREVACAQGASAGVVAETDGGGPATLYSHVVDCRDPSAPEPEGADCGGEAAGNLYVQYWAYYPDSRTAPFGEAGYHPDDWESFQVRIGAGGVEERASSHHGYNGRGGNSLNDVIHTASGWTEATGRYWISSGSHAGRVGTDEAFGRMTLPGHVRVIPIEALSDVWGDYTGSPDHKPAWLKDVYLDPEATGTSG